MSTPEDPTNGDSDFIEGLEIDKSTDAEKLARKKSTLTTLPPLLFKGGQNPGPLVFQGGSPQLDDIETDDSISDAVWRMIKSGEILDFLPDYLKDNPNTLSIKEKDKNTCKMLDGSTDKITITRKTNGSLGFIVDSSKTGGIDPIRLMIATAKCAAELEIQIRTERMLGHKNPTEGETKETREKILKANPKLLHFTINACANATDVALMLIEMKNGHPKLEATLTPNVIAAVNQEVGALSPAHQKVIQEQLNKQNLSPPSPKKPPV